MMVNLANGLAERVEHVDLVLVSMHGPYLSEVSDSVEIVDLKSRRVLSSLPALVRYLRRNRPHVMIATLDHASLAALLARKLAGVDTRMYVREASTLSARSIHVRGGRARVQMRMVRRFFPGADGVIAVSEGVAEDSRSFLSVARSKVTTIYNPVVTPELRARAREALDHPWFRDGQMPVVLGVGSLNESKDFSTLIRAFAAVRERVSARLVILGEGESRSALEELVAELDLQASVLLPGFVQNPFKYMARASAFVLSSKYEGLPGVLIQAMACGCAVVSTNCPSGPNEILEGGRYGPLVPVGDATALANAILSVMEEPLPEVVLMDRADDFSLERSVESYMDLLFGPPSVATSVRSHDGSSSLP